ncbi:hypothetical protein D1814_13315 [Alteromonas sp. BL110]|uniref:hypothetical protein n=1 Tax=Alteromonas sp. BL110 TaxID=1714845 RepID=UPI000E4CBC30|nr:hypothetical protein [Alteromonas sp. BL110]AXT39586.1 hypothetical protein D1814_13315 [Alteromonas sp. BL110]RKM81927.1 hypothetical protein D7031_06235 [Alteromonas sp. BL110]
MDTTYRYLSSSPSLFNYLGDTNNAQSALQDVVEKSKQANALSDALVNFKSELQGNQIDAFLEKMENGDATLNSTTLTNYLEFNRQKLASELNNLAAKFGITDNKNFTISKGKLVVETDDNTVGLDRATLHLQQYLEKDANLTSLIEQTSRLSQFTEWSEATNFASSLKVENADEQTIQSFLKDARSSVMSDNTLIFNKSGFGFSSEGKAKALIEEFQK